MLPISVVIPLAPGEEAWKNLVPQLKLPEGSEVILATGEAIHDVTGFQVRVVPGGVGRAQQMNRAAAAAKNQKLWFLHADTGLGSEVVEKMTKSLAEFPDALHFFDLRFMADGPFGMKLNEWAVHIRAGVLKIPFGDQGFCISKKLFDDVGGYPENVSFGEDHLLVWKVRQAGFPVRWVGAELFTSARKYRHNGWLFTTAKHVWLTLRQGVPELVKLMKLRLAKVV